MNTPSPVPAPADAVAIAALSKKAARDANKLRNREVGHQLKMASQRRPMITRSVPHARGR